MIISATGFSKAAAAAVMAAISSGVMSGGRPMGIGRSNPDFTSTGLKSSPRPRSRNAVPVLVTCGTGSDSSGFAPGKGIIIRFFHPVSALPNRSPASEFSTAAIALAKRPGL